MIHLKDVSYRYPVLNGQGQPALTGVSLHIAAGEMVAVAGAAGSGKTTLIQHLNGLLSPTSGRVHINGQAMETETELNRARQLVGLVFQFPEAQFFEETVSREVGFGPRNRGWTGDRIQTAVKKSLHQVGFESESIGSRSPFDLSGGEKRRVAIASTLAMETEVLVLDEPTVGLDRRSARAIENILTEVHAQGRTVILVTHDMDLIARLCRRVLVLNRGRLCFDGAPEALFHDGPLLQKAGLEPPSVMRYLAALKAQGRHVPEGCLTLEALQQKLN